MSDPNTRDRLEKLQVLSLGACGLGAFMFSPPNKVEMTSIEMAGLGLIGVSTLVFVGAAIVRLTRRLSAKPNSS